MSTGQNYAHRPGGANPTSRTVNSDPEQLSPVDKWEIDFLRKVSEDRTAREYLIQLLNLLSEFDDTRDMIEPLCTVLASHIHKSNDGELVEKKNALRDILHGMAFLRNLEVYYFCFQNQTNFCNALIEREELTKP